MLTFTDQLNRKIHLDAPPKRIISLVPSQTELLYDLGLREEVVGITKFCIHPEEWFRSKTRVGGTKQYHIDRIAALQPDLIIGNKEENEKAQIENLMQQYPVWMSDIYTIEDALQMIVQIGEVVQKKEVATQLAQETRNALQTLPSAEGLRVAYFIWRNPYMVAAKNTFIHEMLEACGFQNCFSEQQRYPEIDIATLQATAPDIVFLSSEPYPFKKQHILELQKSLPDTHICLVDGEVFSWYGSRLLKSRAYLRRLIEESRGVLD